METGIETGGKVLSFGAQAMAVNYPAISQVDAYWEGLRDGRLMPTRGEIDPRGLENALEFAMMMELVAPGIARIRVAGMHLSDLLGMEVRGMPLTAFIEPASRAKLTETLDRVVNRPQVADIKLSSSGGVGRPSMAARLYLAPLSSYGHGNPRILACLQSKGSIGRVPRRFAIDDVHTRRIVAAAGQASEVKPAPRPLQSQPEFSEPVVAFSPAPKQDAKTSERSYLRLVKSD